MYSRLYARALFIRFLQYFVKRSKFNFSPRRGKPVCGRIPTTLSSIFQQKTDLCSLPNQDEMMGLLALSFDIEDFSDGDEDCTGHNGTTVQASS